MVEGERNPSYSMDEMGQSDLGHAEEEERRRTARTRVRCVIQPDTFGPDILAKVLGSAYVHGTL
jgi:hypothetical protein